MYVSDSFRRVCSLDGRLAGNHSVLMYYVYIKSDIDKTASMLAALMLVGQLSKHFTEYVLPYITGKEPAESVLKRRMQQEEHRSARKGSKRGGGTPEIVVTDTDGDGEGGGGVDGPGETLVGDQVRLLRHRVYQSIIEGTDPRASLVQHLWTGSISGIVLRRRVADCN
jgi:hypothetical protein